MFNTEKFNEVVNEALAIAKSSNSKRWIAAINAAVAGLTGSSWIVTEVADGIFVTTESGETYHAGRACGCQSYQFGKPCKHRAAARLIEMYYEAA